MQSFSFDIAFKSYNEGCTDTDVFTTVMLLAPNFPRDFFQITSFAVTYIHMNMTSDTSACLECNKISENPATILYDPCYATLGHF